MNYIKATTSAQYLLLLLLLLVTHSLKSQSIDEAKGIIYFYYQSDIDNYFATNPNITEIPYTVIIRDYGFGAGDTIPLSKFKKIEKIHGGLIIEQANYLTSLTGLENLDSIGLGIELRDLVVSTTQIFENLEFLGGGVKIENCQNLSDLLGFSNMTHINGDLVLSNLSMINDLSDLSNLNSLDGNLEITGLRGLTSLVGLESLIRIENKLLIDGNFKLEHLDNLASLRQINQQIVVNNNYNLLSIEGLANIVVDSFIAGGFELPTITITNNANLQQCELAWMCEMFESTQISAKIKDNGIACSYQGLLEFCDPQVTCLANLYINSQQMIDDFAVLFPNCNAIDGDLVIDEEVDSSIINLNGLMHLQSVGGTVSISGNQLLEDLTGLDSLKHVEGSLLIQDNIKLATLTALSSLESVGGNFRIEKSNALIECSGLENLQSIGGDFSVTQSGGEFAFSGLSNLDSIGGSLNLINLKLNDAFNGMSNIQKINNSISFLQVTTTNFHGLENITKLLDNLTIDRSTMTNFDGLQNLQSITGELKVWRSTIYNYSDFDRLEYVGDRLSFHTDTFDAGMPTFSAIEYVGGDVYIRNIDNQVSYEGFPVLSALGGDLIVGNCDSMASFSGFQSVDTIHGSIYFSGCDQLKSIDMLENLSTVKENIRFSANDNLESISGGQRLTHILGFLDIDGDRLRSLSFFNQLKIINQGFSIESTSIELKNLFDFSSLERTGWFTVRCNLIDSLFNKPTLKQINGRMFIKANSLVSLHGLDSLLNIGGSISINQTPITNLLELSNLKYLGGDLTLYSNNRLQNLKGLAGLTHVSRLGIWSNPNLKSLDGLQNVTKISTGFELRENVRLSDISALANVSPDSIPMELKDEFELHITQNDSLSNCAISIVCFLVDESRVNYLIENNGEGCSNERDILISCTLPNSCFPEGIVFQSQNQIDSFKILFPDCEVLLGTVTIEETERQDIMHLDSLRNVNRIHGSLNIQNNEELISIVGLNSIKRIDGNLDIHYNSALQTFAGLDSLRRLNGYLKIDSNFVLENIDALNALDVETIKTEEPDVPFLTLYANKKLSVCNINPVCAAVTHLDFPTLLRRNAPGCEDREDIIDGCNFPSMCSGDFLFQNQIEINNFIFEYPRCTGIEGNLTFNTGPFSVDNFRGLRQINTVGGDFVIRDSDRMNDLFDLESIREIGGELRIEDNQFLSSLEGLLGLQSVGKGISIYSRAHMTSLLGLDNIQSLGGGIRLSGSNITDISALSQFDSIPGKLELIGAGMKNMSSFNSLRTVEGLSIVNCKWLEDIDDLQNLLVCKGEIDISRNVKITTLDGLDNVLPESMIDENGNPYAIDIYGNHALNRCNNNFTCTFLDYTNIDAMIVDNVLGCNSQQEILHECVVSVVDHRNDVQIIFYPNPTDGNANLIMPKDIEIIDWVLLNQHGQLVQSSKDNLSVSSKVLSSGIYFFRMLDQEHQWHSTSLVKL